MRVVVITKHGGPDVLKVEERADPRLGSGEVRIDVAAAGINFADTMARIGIYPDAPKPPCVIGYEVAGTILELGEGVEGLSHGQRVLAGTKFGGYASQVVVPASDVVPLPDEMSFEQGAAIPVNYATAWAGLIGYGNLQPGERVLINAAAGGVGIAATQIAKRYGAEVYGTASPSKHARIKEEGVDHTLDYTHEGWDVGLPPFDIVLDAIGGKSFRRSYGQRAALQHGQADLRIEGGDRAEHALAVEGPRHAEAVDRAVAGADRRRDHQAGGRRELQLRAGGRGAEHAD
jgi:NADPH:quinone reductase-like Zn-dependent oxidoreductase